MVAKQLSDNGSQVRKFLTKINAETSFKIFLSNLYYKLDCNDKDFMSLLCNSNSNVVYLEYNRFSGTVKVDRYILGKRVKVYKQFLNQNQINDICNEFITKNNIKKVG